MSTVFISCESTPFRWPKTKIQFRGQGHHHLSAARNDSLSTGCGLSCLPSTFISGSEISSSASIWHTRTCVCVCERERESAWGRRALWICLLYNPGWWSGIAICFLLWLKCAQDRGRDITIITIIIICSGVTRRISRPLSARARVCVCEKRKSKPGNEEGKDW